MLSFLTCMLNGGHRYGRWWWPNRPEGTHRICDDCATMQKPIQRKSWFNRARETNRTIKENDVVTKRMTRRTMGNDYGGRKAENPARVLRVSRDDVLSAARIACVEVKRESVRTGCVSAGWSMWWMLRPGDVWRTLATTNYHAVQELQKLNLN